MNFEAIIKNLPKPYFRDPTADIVVYCADCRDILPLIPDKSIDLVLTDPPYGITTQKWDIMPDWVLMGNLFNAIANHDCQIFLFGMQPTFSDMVAVLKSLLYFKDEIIWYYKDGGAGNTKGTGLKNVHQNIAWFSKCEDRFHFNIDDLRIAYQTNERNKYPVKRGNRIWRPNPLGAYPTNVFECPKHKEIQDGRTQFHKHYTIKPMALLERIVRGFSLQGSCALDPFVGTGTTLIACKALNRKCIGIEINSDYCEIAAKRLSQSVMRLEV